MKPERWNEVPTRMKASTSPGMVMGTVHYMSPEQARGLKVDERTDTWSLGCILYEMLTGKQAFDGETPNDVIATILKHDPAPLTSLLMSEPKSLRGRSSDNGEFDHQIGIKSISVQLFFIYLL